MWVRMSGSKTFNLGAFQGYLQKFNLGFDVYRRLISS
jgi:hypothetical protein